MKAILLRNADTEFGVFGYLELFNHAGLRIARFCTAEEDWLDNRPSISCILAGAYTCRRSVWHKTGVATFEITGVPARSRILFHWGNTEEDVQGCILLGRDFGALTVADEDERRVRTKWAVVQSRSAFDEFMDLLEGVDTFELKVKWAAPGEWRAAT